MVEHVATDDAPVERVREDDRGGGGAEGSKPVDHHLQVRHGRHDYLHDAAVAARQPVVFDDLRYVLNRVTHTRTEFARVDPHECANREAHLFKIDSGVVAGDDTHVFHA